MEVNLYRQVTTPEVKRYIEQQHTLAVTAILLRALGDAAPRLDHRCVVVERNEPPPKIEGRPAQLPQPQSATPDYAEIERAKLRRRFHICEYALDEYSESGIYGAVGMCTPGRGDTLTGRG